MRKPTILCKGQRWPNLTTVAGDTRLHYGVRNFNRIYLEKSFSRVILFAPEHVACKFSMVNGQTAP